MKLDIKTQWVAALRSGEYPQGRAVLKSSDGKYCCLGVLCDLAVKAGVIEETDQTMRAISGDDEYWGVVFTGDGLVNHEQFATLPRAVIEWAEVNGDNPHVPVERPGDLDAFGAPSLAELNDYGMTFDQIASIIEEHL